MVRYIHPELPRCGSNPIRTSVNNLILPPTTIKEVHEMFPFIVQHILHLRILGHCIRSTISPKNHSFYLQLHPSIFLSKSEWNCRKHLGKGTQGNLMDLQPLQMRAQEHVAASSSIGTRAKPQSRTRSTGTLYCCMGNVLPCDLSLLVELVLCCPLVMIVAGTYETGPYRFECITRCKICLAVRRICITHNKNKQHNRLTLK